MRKSMEHYYIWRVARQMKNVKMHCVLRMNEFELWDVLHICVWERKACISSEVVPEIHFAALLQLKAPARAISVESTLALNPWCFGAKVVYVRTPGTHPPHRKAIHDSLSVLPKLKKSQETLCNTLHMANYCPTARACNPLTQVPYVPKSLRTLRNIRHLHEWSTSSEGGGSKSLWNKVLKERFQ
jgi:hypothetical protein